jgi:hypothetical protein
MRKVVLTVVTGLLIVGYTGASRAQDVVLHTVTFTASLDCTPGVESGVQIYVDARGPSPGDIIIAGSIQGCQPELGPFLDSSTICDNRPEMLGAVSAEDREDANNMDAGEFTMKACETGSRTFDGRHSGRGRHGWTFRRWGRFNRSR